MSAGRRSAVRGPGRSGLLPVREGGAAVLAALLCLLASTRPGSADGDGGVRAVLFVSPTCPHCRMVEEQALPSFVARFGPRLQIALVSTATPSGLWAFRAACRQYGVPRPGVPMLVVGDQVLLGSQEIPERFPDLVDGLLAAGGSSWPGIPGLEALLAEAAPAAQASAMSPSETPPAAHRALVAAPEPAIATVAPPELPPSPPAAAFSPPSAVAAATPDTAAAVSDASGGRPPDPARPRLSAVPADGPPGLMARIAMDPYGNSLAVLVLVGITAVAARSIVLVRRGRPIRHAARAGWTVPALSLLGLGVVSYLSWVEIGHAEAVCGPVGDCSTVQQSEYATLFGLVPIGVLGVVGFAATLVAWLLARVASGRARQGAAIALIGLTGFGTLFSIYLTFLEPFVIGATCLWCLSSATIMTLLYWLSLAPTASKAIEERTRV